MKHRLDGWNIAKTVLESTELLLVLPVFAPQLH